MKNQTLSIEQMKRLKDLGVDVSKASMVLLFKDKDDDILDWNDIRFDNQNIPVYLDSYFIEGVEAYYVNATMQYLDAGTGDYDHSFCEDCGVFTLQDMLEMMPKIINKPCKNQCAFFRILYRSNGEVSVKYSYGFDDEFEGVFFKGIDLLNCVYQMLCWLAENDYLNKEEQ